MALAEIHQVCRTGEIHPSTITAVWDVAGTDLLLTVGAPVMARVDGKLRPTAGESSIMRTASTSFSTRSAYRNRCAASAVETRPRAVHRADGFGQVDEQQPARLHALGVHDREAVVS